MPLPEIDTGGGSVVDIPSSLELVAERISTMNAALFAVFIEESGPAWLEGIDAFKRGLNAGGGHDVPEKDIPAVASEKMVNHWASRLLPLTTLYYFHMWNAGQAEGAGIDDWLSGREEEDGAITNPLADLDNAGTHDANLDWPESELQSTFDRLSGTITTLVNQDGELTQLRDLNEFLDKYPEFVEDFLGERPEWIDLRISDLSGGEEI